VGAVAAPALARLRRRGPLLSAVLLVGLGAFALIARAPLHPPSIQVGATGVAVPSEPTCHGHH
jgi:hypothetical protein